MNYEELLKILACPKCLDNLELVRENGAPAGFLCPHCRLVYPIRDNIPVMLIEDAVPADEWPASCEGK